MRISVLLLSLILLQTITAKAEDILETLNSLPGVHAREISDFDEMRRGLRRFAATIEQPEDHFRADSPKFQQRLVIFHRSNSEPMVLQTSGYKIFGERLSRLAQIFNTNQIQVEHRFFADSIPASRDWSKMTVRQAAEDFHHIVETFKKTYPGPWVNTGASKGGMTSIFHRRYYPDDLAGTVADVAPISFALEDIRYVDFLEKVGGEKYRECRAKLEDLQKILLEKRNEIIPHIVGDYSKIGGEDIALEFAAIDMPFGFWQYGDPESFNFGCKKVPTRASTDRDLRLFFFEISNPDNTSDPMVEIFHPYYYQAAAELGAPAAKLDHLKDLMKYPYNLDHILPGGVSPAYSNNTMLDMVRWVAEEARSVMFVYGEYDPWTAGAYRRLNTAVGADNHWYQVPGGNHSANVTALAAADREEALTVLSRWFQKSASLELGNAFLQGLGAEESIEDIEFKALRGTRL